MVLRLLNRVLSTPVNSLSFRPIGGGSINETYRLVIDKTKSLFCKFHPAGDSPDLFDKEKNGLELLNKVGSVRTPGLVCCETDNEYQVLILEWIESGAPTNDFWRIFGEQLALLHSKKSAVFGLNEDNYMGALPQSNTVTQDWISFFITQRLEPQLRLAKDNGLIATSYFSHFNNLYKILPEVFPTEKASLLHGDLWSGNFLPDKEGKPVFIDPAVYYGHRSMDLAMTTLFGGFDVLFYEAYHHHYPLPENHRQQWDICNLYPLLIHLNLFGRSYLSRISNIIFQF